MRSFFWSILLMMARCFELVAAGCRRRCASVHVARERRRGPCLFPPGLGSQDSHAFDFKYPGSPFRPQQSNKTQQRAAYGIPRPSQLPVAGRPLSPRDTPRPLWQTRRCSLTKQ
ncbi:hypothetical protein C8Q78DRAFT_842857 [Trametes maxima]|nr:hypothetical protein C8Q78DRAFT_842857 [Trametes maxima]